MLAAVAWRFGPLSRRALGLVSTAFVVLALTQYAEVITRELYGRPINLYYDAPHLPRVFAMFAESTPAWALAAAVVGAAFGLAVLLRVVRWAWTRDRGRARAAARARDDRGGGARGHRRYPFAPGWFTKPVTASYARQAMLVAHVLRGRRRSEPSPPLGSNLARVGGADVFVIFLESYGAATYDRPEVAARLAASRTSLAAAAAATGRDVVSAFVESPTFGGASWLAHASLLAGVEVRAGDRYNLLMTERRDTLVRTFARRGYRTVALMPGLRQDWREGEAFYDFDAIYDAGRLDYRGPAFGWWRIPDQYALAKLERLEAARGPRPPLFVFFPTINSHAPFRPTPPYQPDWARLLSDSPFGPEVDAALREHRTEWTNLGPGVRGFDRLLLRLARRLPARASAREPGADRRRRSPAAGRRRRRAAVVGSAGARDRPAGRAAPSARGRRLRRGARTAAARARRDARAHERARARVRVRPGSGRRCRPSRRRTATPGATRGSESGFSQSRSTRRCRSPADQLYS